MKKLIMMSMATICFSMSAWVYIPFDEAMKKDQFPNVMVPTSKIIGIDGEILYDFFKNLYDTHNLSAAPHREARIPRIIHQIWLGSDLPESFIQLQESWVERHLGSGWSYKLWTDADVAQMELYNQEFYDASDNYGVKSDILRWEIIFEYGGFYADMDAECLQSFEELLSYDFVTALQPLDTHFVQLGAALFGAVPGHPILKHCIETIRDDWHHKGAPKKTGPVHFTKSFYVSAGQNGLRDVALPAYYFYPLGSQERKGKRDEWTNAGAYAVHWWAKSWMPSNYRPARFKDINNEASAKSWND